MLPSAPHLASIAAMGLPRFQPLHYGRAITHQVVMVVTLVVALLATFSVHAQDDFCSANLITMGQYPDLVVVPDSSSAASSRESGLLAGCADDIAYLKCNGTQVLPFTTTDRPQRATVVCDGTSYTWKRVLSNGSEVDLTNSPACVARCSSMCEHFVKDSSLYQTMIETNATKQEQDGGVLFRACDYEVFVLTCVDSAFSLHVNYTQQPDNIVHNNLDLGSDTLTATCTTGASSTEKLFTTSSLTYAKIPANQNTVYSCFAPITTTEAPTTTTEVTTTTVVTTTVPEITTTVTPNTTTTVLAPNTTTPATMTVALESGATTAATGASMAATGASMAATVASTSASGATTAASGATTAASGATNASSAAATTKVGTVALTNPDGSSVTIADGSVVTHAIGSYVVTNPGGSVVTNAAGAVVTYSGDSVLVTNADGSVVTNADGSAVTVSGTTTTAPGSGGSTASPGLGGSKFQQGQSFSDL